MNDIDIGAAIMKELQNYSNKGEFCRYRKHDMGFCKNSR